MKQNKEDFLTGVGAVDAEHVVLLDLTDQVGALLADENMCGYSTAFKAAGGLHDDALYT